MKPVARSWTQTIYKGNEANVLDLPAARDGDAILSVWDLTDMEREEIAKGAEILLMVQGKNMPPVSLNIILLDDSTIFEDVIVPAQYKTPPEEKEA